MLNLISPEKSALLDTKNVELIE